MLIAVSVEGNRNCVFCFHLSVSGGSDDGLNCAVMLEVLEVLSRSDFSQTQYYIPIQWS